MCLIMHLVVQTMMLASMWTRQLPPPPTELFTNMLVTHSNTQVVIILSCYWEIILVTHEVGQKWSWCVTYRNKHGVRSDEGCRISNWPEGAALNNEPLCCDGFNKEIAFSVCCWFGSGGNKKLGACTFWVGTYPWREYNLGVTSHFLSPNIHGNCNWHQK